MTQVNMQQVKELRDRTQAGLNDCRSALVEASGDMDKAVEIILKKGLAKSAKRAGFVASEGVVAAQVAPDGHSGVIVEVNIQTDFAARNEDYLGFVGNVVQAAAKAAPGADLGNEAYPAGGGTVEEVRQALVGRLGENITVRRWDRLAIDGSGKVHAYVHMGGKIGVLLAVSTASDAVVGNEEFTRFVDDVAMQIAAMAPLYMSGGDVPDADKNKQRAIFDAQLAEEGKPEQVRPKIVEGKVAKWFKEVCLLEQQSVMDTEKTIDQMRAALSKSLGTDIRFERFVRYERGEGIQKVAEDFAAEVAKSMGS
jgi:elongation factor Ts